MNSEFANVIRPEPLEDAILRILKRCEIYSLDDNEVYHQEVRYAYEDIADQIRTALKGEYYIGWENDNHNIGWIPCEIKMPEEDEVFNGKKVINVLVTTDKGSVTKVQRIYDEYIGWHWGRVRGKMKAWMPLPKPFELYGI